MNKQPSKKDAIMLIIVALAVATIQGICAQLGK